MRRFPPALLLGGAGLALVVLSSSSSKAPKSSSATVPSSRVPPPPVPRPNVKKPSPASPTTGSSTSVSGALLDALRRKVHEPPTWVEVPWPEAGLVLTVGAHALRAPLGPNGKLVRIPASYLEGIEIDRGMNWIAPTAEVSDAIWRASTVRLQPVPMGASPLMASEGVVLAYNDKVDAQIPPERFKELAADEGKDWIVSNRNLFMNSKAATTYGWRNAKGVPIQELGRDSRPPAHNFEHVDYSQVKRPIQRMARRMSDGTNVDLATVYKQRGIRDEALIPYTFSFV